MLFVKPLGKELAELLYVTLIIASLTYEDCLTSSKQLPPPNFCSAAETCDARAQVHVDVALMLDHLDKYVNTAVPKMTWEFIVQSRNERHHLISPCDFAPALPAAVRPIQLATR